MKSTSRRCANCKKKVPAVDALIGGLRAFCSFDCMRSFTSSDRGQEAIRTQKEKQVRADRRIFREKSKSRGQWMREAQAAFNAYIRWRDRNDPCISCGKHVRGDLYGGNIDAGHYLARGSNKGHFLRFHTWNTHAQCVHCNRYKNGAVADFRVGLIWKIGHEKVEWLETQNHHVDYSVEYLKRIKSIFASKLKIKMKINSQKC